MNKKGTSQGDRKFLFLDDDGSYTGDASLSKLIYN